MRDNDIRFGMIRTQEEYKSLQAFAKSFEHNIDNGVPPIYTIEAGDRTIGYFNLVMYPVVSPAFHPKVCTPREFYTAARDIRQHFCMGSINDRFRNGTCLLALPWDLAFDKTMVERCGFKRTGKEFWQSV